jgi:hypothetical protein
MLRRYCAMDSNHPILTVRVKARRFSCECAAKMAAGTRRARHPRPNRTKPRRQTIPSFCRLPFPIGCAAPSPPLHAFCSAACPSPSLLPPAHEAATFAASVTSAAALLGFGDSAMAFCWSGSRSATLAASCTPMRPLFTASCNSGSPFSLTLRVAAIMTWLTTRPAA